MERSECVVGDKRDRQSGGPISCEREAIHAMWDRIMGSQGSSALVLASWKMKDLRRLRVALINAAGTLGVKFEPAK